VVKFEWSTNGDGESGDQPKYSKKEGMKWQNNESMMTVVTVEPNL
jgi:hypothetical protein